MDDPWANAWGEPAKPPLSHKPSTDSWNPSPIPLSAVHDEQEADLAMPSWSTGAGIQWDEPTNTNDTSLWSRDPIAATAAWVPEPSPYDNISIGKSSAKSSISERTPSPLPEEPHPSPPPRSASPVHEEEPPTRDSPIQVPADLPSFSATSSLSTQSSPASFHSAPDSPDAFGTFETALHLDEVDEEESWAPSNAAFSLPSADADAWGTTWSAPDSAATVESTSTEPVDEWEAAKTQKERQDRHVPPELLASILQQVDELTNDLWPKEESIGEQVELNRQSDLSESLGLTTVVNRIIPQDLTLSPLPQFSKSFTSKSTMDALRLTRHLPITRLSPMAMYMASKGSTSWEAAVKSRSEAEDVTPVGWRVIEKTNGDASPADDGKKKAGGGILSFFGRKAVASEAGSAISRPPSTPPAATAAKSGTPRGSVDSTRSAAVPSGTNSARGSISSPTTASFASTKAPEQSTPAIPPPTVQPDIPREPTPPPSAVSRFLGRFSRGKSSGNTSRNSLALSTDDLEFLSDIVPSANDDEEHGNDASLDALKNMIESSPLPTKLPPPLAPPPKAPPLPRPSLTPARTSSSTRSSGFSSPVKQVIAQSTTTTNDNFMSFFDTQALEPTPAAATPSPIQPPPNAPISLSRPLSPTIPTFTTPPILSMAPTPAAPAPKREQSDFLSLVGNTPTTEDDAWASFDFEPPPAPAPTSAATSRSASARTSRAHTPALPPKRTVTAIMSNSPSASVSPSIPPLSAFGFPGPPPPGSRPQHSRAGSSSASASAGGGIAPLPPPPASRARTPLPPPLAPAPAPATSENDNDEFADFLSSPAQASAPYPSFDSSFSSTSSASFVKDSNSISFDDFDDFVTSPLRTPSPPRLPAKPVASAFRPPPLPPIQVGAASPPKPQPKPSPPRRASRAADHSRTLSLMEVAAARGKWPAPPSPLPEAIPPPEPAGNTHVSGFDIFNEGSAMQAQQANAMANFTSTPSPPPGFSKNGSFGVPKPTQQWGFPPPNTSVMQPSPRATSPAASSLLSAPDGLFANQPQIQASRSPAPSSTPTSQKKSGGLSAQDLSFFEGL
ncbi:hypothetical protein BDQ12DRAFT_681529 [Crucibulum laeve]|uniref:Uncharacterized protein n=1 Tax=Crucibulum laeve TaxID=68775 RepID=A0A5C3M409_9AGAR|nr:hypothetical protein BDQ12DRAFT_681529 [Crucibulum laeve]